MQSPAALLELTESHIDLWLAFPDAIQDPHLLASYRELLTADERERELRFRSAEGQKQHLITRALVRTTLSRYTGVAPAEWRFTTNEQGRPDIDSRAGPAAGLSFNLSHTRGLIVCAVARCRAIGVDVEHLDRSRSRLHLAERYFAPCEVAALRALPADQQDGRFFDYWTLKEAYIKAIGKGLAMPLSQFSLEWVGANGLRFRGTGLPPEEEAAWHFWLLKPGIRHTLSVCLLNGVHGRTLRTRAVVPLRGEEEATCLPIRASGTIRDDGPAADA